MNPQILDEGFNRRYGMNLVEEVVDESFSTSEDAIEIIDNFDPVAKSYNYKDGYWSVEIEDHSSKMTFWVDVSINKKYGDVDCDWNQYIFNTNDDDDVLREMVQEDTGVFDSATSEAIYFLEDEGQIKQDKNGRWVSNLSESCEDCQEKEPVEESCINESSHTTNDLFFKAFITNLGKYNEGELVGDWIEFPIDEDEFYEKLEELGISDKPDEDGNYYEEWFVTDYDTNLPEIAEELGEYPGYERLNEIGELIENCTCDETALLNALEVEDDLEYVINGLDNGDIRFYEGVYDWGDLAERLIDELYGGIEQYLKDCPDEIENHFDYERLGRDLGFDSYENDEGEDISAGEYWCNDDNASDDEIGEAYVNEVGLDGVGNPEYYFDYESWGNDLRYDNFYMTSDGCIELVR